MFLFGKLLGTQSSDLIWYLTFSDLVNLAPSTVLLIGLTQFVFILNDGKLRSHLKSVIKIAEPHSKTLGLISIAIGLIIFAVIGASGARALGLLGFLALVFIYLSVNLYGPAEAYLGKVSADAIDSLFFATFVSLCFGFNIGNNALKAKTPVIVCTDYGLEVGNVTLPLDRGLALIQSGGFRLIPWSGIKKVDAVDGTSPELTRFNSSNLPAMALKACAGTTR